MASKNEESLGSLNPSSVTFPPNFPRINHADLKKLKDYTPIAPPIHLNEEDPRSLFKVSYNNRQTILKIYTAGEKSRNLQQELKIYKTLGDKNCKVVPKLLALVYKKNDAQAQIVGFMCERFIGRKVSIEDLDICKKGLKKLHEYGVYHGDFGPGLSNILIVDGSARFYDFEISGIERDWHPKDFEELCERDLKQLVNELRGL